MSLADLRLAAGTVHLERTSFGRELHRGVFRITVDGRKAGILPDPGSAVDLSLEPGPHTLQVTAGRFSSAVREIQIFDGGVLQFRTHGAVLWPRYLASLVKPELGINLHRV